ncbi:unnamed protein product [Prunus armeniaca]|uniref:F-box associated beta-propeller type 1 domain-containing protein n=1 Tax=Prunus armeniaca TaxID=36596 RepID=A0A6J5WVC4_PRUAR|nr:unnamed protein product [Prunus armeniaca]
MESLHQQPMSLLSALDFIVAKMTIRLGFELKEFEVEVYSLRLNSWRRISAVPPYVSVSEDECAFLNGVVYWSTREPFQGSTFILSFDFGSEEFRRIMLPHEVRIMLHHERTSFRHIHIRVFEKSLSFFHRRRQDGQPGWFYDVWVLEMDTWKKTCTPERGCLPGPLVFTGNGRFLMVMTGTFSKGPYLVLYDPEAHQTTNTGIKMMKPCGYVDAYIESLILLK